MNSKKKNTKKVVNKFLEWLAVTMFYIMCPSYSGNKSRTENFEAKPIQVSMRFIRNGA